MKEIISKINLKKFIICYCSALCLYLLFMSVSYGQFHTKLKAEKLEFSSGWSVSVNGKQPLKNASLPFVLKGLDAVDIEMRNTIPKTPYVVAVLETMVFQKDIQVYIDGILVEEKIFESKNFNQKTPGSGRVFVPLPEDSVGKEIVIKLHKVVLEDEGAVVEINILDGVMSERNIVSISGEAFIATTLMLFMGICLLVTSIIYTCSGIRMHSMMYMSMFVITSSMWILCNSKVIQYFIDNWVLVHNLEYICLYSAPLWLWLFLSCCWNFKEKICNIAIRIMALFFVVTLSAKVLGICDFFASLKVFHLLIAINIIIIMILEIRNRRRQPQALKFFFLGVMCLCVTGVVALMRYYTTIISDAMAYLDVVGIIFMELCVLCTFALMTKEKLRSTVEDTIYKKMALSDILTGLYNRAKWEIDITEIEDQIDDYQSVIAVMIDMNDLKKVNDRFGHQAGDEMLISMSRILQTRLKGVGNCYRLGGDEFCVIVVNNEPEEIDRIFKLAASDIKYIEAPYRLSFAYGYAKYNKEKHKNISSLVREADNRMYEMKRSMKQESTL